ncbi:MAG: hypothetical protein KatS3mg072_1368 [Meiothermus sp.]|nr:MAG: hypothetical protein KatS3mg072_1368 [Meiothermus sp.]
MERDCGVHRVPGYQITSLCQHGPGQQPGADAALWDAGRDGFGLFFVGSVRIVDARAKAHRVSTLQSLRNGLAFGLAHLIAGPVGGAVYQAQGPGTLFLLVAFVFL